MTSITVVIPVGPYEGNKRWLIDAVASVEDQVKTPYEILFINDGAWSRDEVPPWTNISHRVYTPPWRLGVGHAFNFGVGLSHTECVFMMGSDDLIHRNCLMECARSYEQSGGRDGYYWVPVQYMDDGHIQREPCNAAMVTKRFWNMTGGFPIEATTGCDAALLSICIAHNLPRFQVSYDPLYYYRSHDDTDTRKHGSWWQTVIDVRNHVTREWKPPGKYITNYGSLVSAEHDWLANI